MNFDYKCDLERNLIHNFMENDAWIVLTPLNRQTATEHLKASRSSRVYYVNSLTGENGIRFPRMIPSRHIYRKGSSAPTGQGNSLYRDIQMRSKKRRILVRAKEGEREIERGRGW